MTANKPEPATPNRQLILNPLCMLKQCTRMCVATCGACACVSLLLWVCSYSDVIYIHLCTTSACIRHTKFALMHITTDFKNSPSLNFCPCAHHIGARHYHLLGTISIVNLGMVMVKISGIPMTTSGTVKLVPLVTPAVTLACAQMKKLIMKMCQQSCLN